MKIIEKKIPFPVIEVAGYEIDFKEVFKIVLLFAMLVTAYNLGAYVQAYNMEVLMNQNPIDNININLSTI